MKIRFVCSVAWFVAAMAAFGEGESVWRATALDSRTVVLQGDYTDVEKAAFSMTEEEKELGGWKFDNAFRAAAERAQEGRPDREAKLKAGPYGAAGAEVSEFGWWKYPIGCSRFPGKDGKPRGHQLADVMEIVYLRLAKPMKPGAKIEFTVPTGETVPFVYEPEKIPTPLIKVNQVGYSPSQGKKFAYLGMWLGPSFGAYEPADGLSFELVDAKSGKTVKSGPLVSRRPDSVGKDGPFFGETTLEMDFSDVSAPGRYFIRVPGIGRSYEFPIDEGAIGRAFAVHMKGLFQQRCGCAKTADLTHWTDEPCHTDIVRGLQPSGEWEFKECFTDKDGKKIQCTHFSVLTAMTRDYTEHLSLPGGWHDAADYDRRPHHLEVVNSLAMLYILRRENFKDGQLAVPERGNGIPDILDEAEWGLRHLLKGQQKDGGVGTWIETRKHPAPNDGLVASGDDLQYCLAKATRQSSLEYAAHASLLARAFARCGTPDAKKIAGRYKKSAIDAFAYSRRPVGEPVQMRSGWYPDKETDVWYHEPEALDPNDTVKACINLYALTKDPSYLEILDSVKDAFRQNTNKAGWRFGADKHAEVLFTKIDHPAYEFVKNFWNERMLKEANEMIDSEEGPNAWAYRLPWHTVADWRVGNLAWAGWHPLRRAKTLCYAHALTGEQKYLDAAYVANDYHNGCNPNGSTLTSGLGIVYPVSFLSIVSVNDGIDEYVPGITPYRCTYGMAPDVRKRVWNWEEPMIKWPFLRQWPNMEEYSVGSSEYTVWETIAPAVFTTGYLVRDPDKVPFENRVPAKSRRDLPGYWALP